MQKFWNWYEKHLFVNTVVAAGLFVIQLAHLTWLTTDVVAQRLVGQSYLNPTGIYYWLILLADYVEIPALLSTTLLYINELRKKFNKRDLMLLLSVNSQWLHIFWITDEFVVDHFAGQHPELLPMWVAWLAIGIDYLELPVIFDTIKRVVKLRRIR